jgi:hypothetical protein
MSSIHHLIYASVATQDVDASQLLELLAAARARNAGIDVTGMLLYQAKSFFQVLEGSELVISRLYARIGEDSRHKAPVVVINEPISKRAFGDWSMGFAHVSDDELAGIDGLNDFFSSGSVFGELGSGRAKRLVGAFSEGRWHARLDGLPARRVGR